MPYRNMSLEDFAKYVGMDAREVHKLADRGKLPGQKVGGEWRFNRARVTEWLQQEMHTLDEARLTALEEALGKQDGTPAQDSDMIVTSLIGVEGIDPCLPAKTKASVIKELVNLADRTGLLYDAEGLTEALEARESMCATALPNGVALPHPRKPMPYVSAEPLVCVARVPSGIGYGAAQGELTKLFMLICCHEDRHHLRVLARLMRILDHKTVDALLEAEDAQGMLEVLLAAESRVSKSQSK
jgi:PTS system nitrogen regulatory IIA component